MIKIRVITCDGCGQLRRWKGYECLDTCPCLTTDDEPCSGADLDGYDGEAL